MLSYGRLPVVVQAYATPLQLDQVHLDKLVEILLRRRGRNVGGGGPALVDVSAHDSVLSGGSGSICRSSC